MMHSIRQRLLFGLLAGLGLVLAASGHVAYRQARTEVNALFDYQLQQTALALRNQNWLSLMFGVMKVANFAYGAVYMLGGYAAFWASNLLGVPNWAAMPLAMC